MGSSDPLLTNATLLETTSGHLLAQDQWLYLTVREFRKRAEQADTITTWPIGGYPIPQVKRQRIGV